MPSEIKIEIRAQLHKDGKIIKTLPWRRANSLLKCFIQILTIQMSQLAQTIKATDNTDNSTGYGQWSFGGTGVVGVTTDGVLIGTGTTPVVMTDYKLQTQVTANIAHGAASFAVENPDASTWRLAIARVFTNSTGASLGIREVAIYVTAGTGVIKRYCIDHTLYSVDVPNGVAVTLTYRITISL